MRCAAGLKTLSDVLDGVIAKVVTVLIVALIFTITLQIVSRSFFQAFTWTEELSRYLLVWSTFLGATLAYKRGLHISITIVVDALHGRFRSLFVVLGYALSLYFFGLAIWNGFELMVKQIFHVSPALQLPMRWIYLGIPLGFSVMSVHALAKVAEELVVKSKEGAA